jgi:hypothetical protein
VYQLYCALTKHKRLQVSWKKPEHFEADCDISVHTYRCVCAASLCCVGPEPWEIMTVLVQSHSSPACVNSSSFHDATAPSGPGSPLCQAFTTLRITTLGRTPLDKWSALRRDLYLTTHNIHKRQTSKPLAGFKPTIPASEQPQTHNLGMCELAFRISITHSSLYNRTWRMMNYTVPSVLVLFGRL